METKVCKTCKKEKRIELFTKNKNCKQGVSNLCLECKREIQKKWRRENKDYFRAITREGNKKRRHKDPQKYREYKRNLYKKNSESKRETLRIKGLEYYHKNKATINQRQKIANNAIIENLGDSYIISKIKRESGLSVHIIKSNPFIVEAKRELVKLKRAIKNGKQQHRRTESSL